MDEDLGSMSREQLIDEVRKLRRGIRTHRDSTGHELCWHHPALWGLLPEKQNPLPVVPEWPEFIRGCVIYRQSLDKQAPDHWGRQVPFKSKAQRRKFAELLMKGEISPETFEEWNRETGGAKLPERVTSAKKGSSTRKAKSRGGSSKSKTKSKRPVKRGSRGRSK